MTECEKEFYRTLILFLKVKQTPKENEIKK